jgi:hypothetical protein
MAKPERPALVACANRETARAKNQHRKGGGAIIRQIFQFHIVIKFPLPNSQKFKRFIPLLSASGALLLSQGQAKAVLTYNIFEASGNVVVETSGNLNLAGATVNTQDDCPGQIIVPIAALICTVPGTVNIYSVTGPTSFSNGGATPAIGSS